MPLVAKQHDLLLGEPLSEVPSVYYSRIFRYLEALRLKANSPKSEDHQKKSYTIANYLYLIHERINLKIVRDIDYKKIQVFARKNKDLIVYLFEKEFSEFSIESLLSWIEPTIDILDCGLYRPSNRHNKHVFH